MCFVSGTSVDTPNGSVPIEVLTGADSVVGYSLESHQVVNTSATTRSSSWASHVVHILLRRETITCTQEHPFWVIDRGWVMAGALNPGDSLLDRNGDGVVVDGVTYESLQTPVRVYNLTVSSVHTYFVGQSGVLVHNKPR